MAPGARWRGPGSGRKAVGQRHGEEGHVPKLRAGALEHSPEQQLGGGDEVRGANHPGLQPEEFDPGPTHSILPAFPFLNLFIFLMVRGC